MPRRIQRKSTKGWKMPPNVVYVGRPTKWGNPFWHAERFAGLEFSVRCFRMAAMGYWDPGELKDMPEGPFHVATRDFSEWIIKFPDGPYHAIQENLRGKDLACWCALVDDEGKSIPCHADVLLEIANTPEVTDAEQD